MVCFQLSVLGSAARKKLERCVGMACDGAADVHGVGFVAGRW